MTIHVALLRGINVGGHRRIPMADLRALCADLGFRDPRTYVQSGNLVFESALSPQDAATALEEALLGRFGFPVDVMAVDAETWRRYVEQNPLADEAAREPSRTVLLLLARPPAPDLAERLEARGRDGEVVRAVGGVLYLHFPAGLGKSKLPGSIDREAGSPGTIRNWNTVLALDALAAKG